MVQLILSTGNIVSGGPSIIRKPGLYRSNLELTNSLRSAFIAAQQDYATDPAAAPVTNGNGSAHAHSSSSSRPPMSAWTTQEDNTLYIPRLDDPPSGLQEEPAQYETTVKLFFLPTAPASSRESYAREALRLVRRELGDIPKIDLLIVSYPGMSFDGDCEWEADKLNSAQGSDADEEATWRVVEALQSEGVVGRTGVAEFGSEKLKRFLGYAKSRPAVDQINIKDCCNVPPPLVELAKKEGIELLTHSDCTDILPEGTLRELLGRGLQGAGVLGGKGDEEEGEAELKGELVPQWVVKYTAVVRDRGVIENKGYFAGAELIPSGENGLKRTWSER